MPVCAFNYYFPKVKNGNAESTYRIFPSDFKLMEKKKKKKKNGAGTLAE